MANRGKRIAATSESPLMNKMKLPKRLGTHDQADSLVPQLEFVVKIYIHDDLLSFLQICVTRLKIELSISDLHLACDVLVA